MAETREDHRNATRRWRWAAWTAVALALLATLGVFRRPLLWGNFGVVDPGRVYRCAQPKENLDQILNTYQPDAILNLRGGSEADGWYAAELRASRQRGIDFYDVPLSPVRRPTRQELLAVLDVLERCRYPLLIHCKSGADRTGLVSGLYLMARRGESPEQALGAFSIAHGHIPIGGPEHLHEPFQEYDTWLKANHLTHSPQRFQTWVEHEYQPDEPSRHVIAVRPGPRPKPHGIMPR